MRIADDAVERIRNTGEHRIRDSHTSRVSIQLKVIGKGGGESECETITIIWHFVHCVQYRYCVMDAITTSFRCWAFSSVYLSQSCCTLFRGYPLLRVWGMSKLRGFEIAFSYCNCRFVCMLLFDDFDIFFLFVGYSAL